MQVNDRVQLNASAPKGYEGRLGTVVDLLPYDAIQGNLGLQPPADSTQFVFVNVDEPEWEPLTDADIAVAQLLVGLPNEVAELSKVHRMALIVSDTHLNLISVTDEADNEATV